MTYRIIFDKDAEKSLKHIPKADQARIIHKIEKLSLNPRPSGVVALQLDFVQFWWDDFSVECF